MKINIAPIDTKLETQMQEFVEFQHYLILLTARVYKIPVDKLEQQLGVGHNYPIINEKDKI